MKNKYIILVMLIIVLSCNVYAIDLSWTTLFSETGESLNSTTWPTITYFINKTSIMFPSYSDNPIIENSTEGNTRELKSYFFDFNKNYNLSALITVLNSNTTSNDAYFGYNASSTNGYQFGFVFLTGYFSIYARSNYGNILIYENSTYPFQGLFNIVKYSMNCTFDFLINNTRYYTLNDTSCSANSLKNMRVQQYNAQFVTAGIDNILLTSAESTYFLNFTFYDAVTNNTIGDVLQCYLSGLSTGYNSYNVSVNSYVMFYPISNEEYVLTCEGSQYHTVQYKFTLSNTFHQYSNFSIYVYNSSSSFLNTFYVKDYGNDKYVDDALVTIKTFLNNSLITVFSGYSDGFGVVYPWLNSSKTYDVAVTKSNYAVRTLSFIPSSPYTYTIYLSPSTAEYHTCSEGVSYSVDPTPGVVYNSSVNSFNYNVYSGNNGLEYFGISSTINGTSYSNISYASSGGQINITSGLLGNVVGQYINVSYYSKLANLDGICWYNTTYYVMSYNAYGNMTLIPGIASLTSQFSMTERILIPGVIGLLLTAWFSYFIPGAYAAGVGLFAIGVFAVSGFFPQLLFGIMACVGLVLWFSGEGGGS